MPCAIMDIGALGEGGGVRTDPDPHRGCTNEATPRGESPEAIRPDTEGEETPRGERPEAIRPDTEDTHAHARACRRLADPPRSESARGPFWRPGCKPTHRLCDQSVRVPIPDPCILLFTPVVFERRLILRD